MARSERLKRDKSTTEVPKPKSRGANLLEDGVTVKSPTEIEFSDYFQTRLADWKEVEGKMVSEMCCCAFCGHTDLRDKNVSSSNRFELVSPTPEGNQVVAAETLQATL